MAHSKRKREQAVSKLEASARDHGGAPQFAMLAEALGIPETSLRRWWADKDKPGAKGRPKPKAKPAPKADLHVLPPPDRLTPQPGEAPIDPLAAPPSAFWAWMFAETYGDIRDAKDAEASPYVVAQMRPALGDYYEKCRAAMDAERAKGRGLTDEEREAKLRDTMRRLPPRDALIAAEELRARKIVS